MQYTKLGNSDLLVSRICMGCMGFGEANQGQHAWTLDEAHSRAIIKRGLELGVNFFDTAIGYQSGTSEQYVGRALNELAKRDEVVVATKFLPRTQGEIDAGVTGQQHIEQMVNTSLKNLGMDYIDLYIYHMWDYQTPLYDVMEGLDRMVKAGKVRYIGISNCFAYQLAKDIGSMAAVLRFEVDAIVYTGGMAYSESLCREITSYVSKVAPVICLPGEEEMRSLAEGALRVLHGGKCLEY